MTDAKALTTARAAKRLLEQQKREADTKASLEVVPGGQRFGVLARPAPKLSDGEARGVVLGVLRCGGTLELAARVAGASRRALAHYLKRGRSPDATAEEAQFAADVEDALSDAEGLFFGVVADAALGLNGGAADWRAAAFALSCRWPATWGTKHREITVEKTEEIRHSLVVSLLSDANVRAALEAAGAQLPDGPAPARLLAAVEPAGAGEASGSQEGEARDVAATGGRSSAATEGSR